MKRKNIIFTLACGIVALAFTACTDVWEEHYQPNPELNADETLWELIDGDKEQLSEFAAFLKATGYDTLLTKSRYYTVWAPVNGAEFFKNHPIEGATKAQLDEYRKELVENHIADYSHVAGGKLSEDNMVKMLNGKYIRFENTSGKFSFKGIPLKESNVPAKNGVLHKIDGYANFTANIWEQLAKEESLDSLYSFLVKDYKREPNWSASVQGPVVDGQITYLDTAWSVTCPWFNSLGQLNREDSSYTMFALTNRAWDEMYEMTKKYFVYADDFEEGDSVQEAVVKELMCSNLVFSDKVNRQYANNDPKVPFDTLISNYNFPYTYEPLVFGGDEVKALYEGVTSLALSNGTLNIVDQVNYDPLKCWHDTIRVEGENLKGGYTGDENAILNEYANCDKSVVYVDKDSALYESVSKGAVGVFKNDANNPRLDFKINNVLSACYRVKVVVFPPDVLNPYDTLYIKPNLFYATLTHGSRELKGATQDIVLGRKDSCLIYSRSVYSDPTRIDTIELVPLMMVDETTYQPTGVDYVEIPVCEYQEESKLNGTFQTKLNITSYLGQYDLKFMDNYKKDKNKYVDAVRAYNAADAAYLVADEALKALAELETVTEEEIGAAEEALAEALVALDKAKEALDKAKQKVTEMDKEYLKYLDTTLRIDQIILEPITPDNN